MNLKLNRSKLEFEIIRTLEKQYDVFEPENEFYCEFEIKENANTYQINFPFYLNQYGIIDFKTEFIDCRNNGQEVNLIIISRDANPNSKSLQEKINNFLKSQGKEKEEMQEDAIHWAETMDILNRTVR